MKVITDIELLKKIQPILEDRETEYQYCVIRKLNKARDWHILFAWVYNDEVEDIKKEFDCNLYIEIYKTLTLEEAIEILPKIFSRKMSKRYNIDLSTDWDQRKTHYYCCIYNLQDWRIWDRIFRWDTPIEAIEKMLQFLIDNWHLWKN